ncbi:MAG TPA: GYD domain-containing protein, partial [Roseiflexaceae bacterium]
PPGPTSAATGKPRACFEKGGSPRTLDFSREVAHDLPRAAGQACRQQSKSGRSPMAFYLMRFSYTPETWAKLMQNPEDRRDAARAYIEQVGGALHGFWYGFGKYDGYAIYEAPDNVSLAGAVLAITAGGALASVETTVLMTVEETLEALAKGKRIGYRRPGESPAT